MPKIEVNEEVFYTLAGRRWNTKEEFEDALSSAKAELDEDSDKKLPPSERILKIELNDTNRPDLWGTAGCARQLRVHNGGKMPDYPFFSKTGDIKKASKKVKVEKSVQKVRPFLAGFIASGKAISDPMLRDMIQTQEKLAWNFGRKRRTISMGLYRIGIIKWPIIYKAVDPDSVSFVPLQWDVPLTLREILKQHPKGKEYGFIQEHEPLHPLLTDTTGAILSYPPIINSADLGAVQVGDTDLFVELTGTDLPAVTLAASIVACDLADNGFTIEPVEVEYEYDTPFGKNVTTPWYFQEPVFCSLARVEKVLGEKLSADDCLAALAGMGVRAEKATEAERGGTAVLEGVKAWPPEYRNDFLHAADVAEDVMMGRGLNTFKPERPHDFTVGRLTPITLFSRKVKEIMVGLGYQEMIYNYLGSRKDFVEKMRGDGKKTIRISNPMTENYEYVRDSVLTSLMSSESVSGHAVYPHKIFEIGKVAYLNDKENYGTSTRQYLGFLHADRDANFNTLAGQLQTLFYYINSEYQVEESRDSRFIPGRAANIIYKGRRIGVFGELHPELLENWGVAMPCTAAEIDIEAVIS
ncbi:phenylalanine--tRNA ligase subunit beta [Leadbettera azotonutricia]|uniref:Phenylalanine--tRNA ligase beta subunit n=1 Tax=Leadbettera azotonutricia (strain ATCC BAA-888 / DSM 13862 / ZAS-9) TaxID=545695 RepID=F5YEF7_LEAAZ|nr:phenylalanine--tRNA ligase subunit beta [Leadbettera azotonutricia]AEF82911.1 phenylalanyl-tRNA synthetase, beta subunit [Leadbettera azotonutricia ZAS-9]